MNRTNKTFDAVKVIRAIRDKHHEQFKGKPMEERRTYYRQKAKDFRNRTDQIETEEAIP